MDDGILIAFLKASTLISFMKGAFGLGVVIFVHELGHFLVAKACGVKCEKFYVGFDPPLRIAGINLPRTLFKKQWGETEYGIGIVPLGGYVKMLGQDDNPANAAAEAERIRLSGQQLDPRSYPAKSVPQRMAIISAGVIFNLIFGILFATAAYRMGVKYTPTVVGGASVGDPAWLAGIKPGDRIVSLSSEQPDDERLRFNNDLRMKMFSLNPGDTVDMRLKDTDGEIRGLTVKPDSGYKKLVGTPTIGIWMAKSPIVYAVVEGSIAKEAGLLPGDVIESVTVDGATTNIDTKGTGIDLQAALARSQHRPITLGVRRKDAETDVESTASVTLGVDSSERFGIELSYGPIVCVQKGSVAEQAGLQVGDVIQSINGQPAGDPLTLPIRMLEYVQQDIQLEVLRAGQPVTFDVRPASPLTQSAVRRRDGPIGIDSLGLGYVMHPTVKGVVPDSPASQAGIQTGDVLVSAQLIMPETSIPEDRRWKTFPGIQEYLAKRANRTMLEAYELDKAVLVDEDNNNWPFVVTSVQDATTKFEIDLNYQRNGEDKTVRLKPARSETTVDTSRGFILKGLEETRTAASLGEAFTLGRREVWEGMKQVVFVLRKMRSNYKNLGGPLTIVAAATMEASEGWPRLFIFLTLLSANLAVLNFLPIPVLDGGHMLFLAYEGIVGKPVDERIQMSLTLLGFGLLMGLMVFVFTLDINRFLG